MELSRSARKRKEKKERLSAFQTVGVETLRFLTALARIASVLIYWYLNL